MKCRKLPFSSFSRLLAFPLFLLSGPTLSAQEDVSTKLLDHVMDGSRLELFPYLKTIHLPFGITVNEVMLFLAISIITILYAAFSRKRTLKPRKFQLGLEAIIMYVRDDIVYPIMGQERGREWVSFFSSMFIFLLTVNLLGLIPAFKTATGNINVTTAMAILVFLLTFIIGLKKIGFKAFFKNMFPEGTAVPIGLFVAFLEFVTMFTKSLVLSLRLFANMLAGHLAILSFLVMMFIISPFFGLISVPFALFTYLLEVLIVVLQALVFTLLSCIYISMASTTH